MHHQLLLEPELLKLKYLPHAQNQQLAYAMSQPQVTTLFGKY